MRRRASPLAGQEAGRQPAVERLRVLVALTVYPHLSRTIIGENE
jgi:hypothetical protein